LDYVSFLSGPDVGVGGGGEVILSINGTGVLQITSITLQEYVPTYFQSDTYELSQIEINNMYSSPGDRAASTTPNANGYYTWYLPVTLTLEASGLQTVEVTVTVHGQYGPTSILTIMPITITASHRCEYTPHCISFSQIVVY
jgi:selenocysteine lyase/cysteine desulfurase